MLVHQVDLAFLVSLAEQAEMVSQAVLVYQADRLG